MSPASWWWCAALLAALAAEPVLLRLPVSLGRRRTAQLGPPRHWRPVAGGAAVAGLLVLVGGAGWALPGVLAVMGWMWVRRRARAARRRLLAERGTAPLARALADAVRGGRSLRGAVAAAANDGSVPAATRAAAQRLTQSLTLGTPLTPALHALASEGDEMLRLLSATLALHHGHGGRLAQELDDLARDAERAQRLREERASATAQARATVRTVAALPPLALLAGEVLGGGMVGRMLSEPIAGALLLLGLMLEVVAVLAARTLVRGIG